LHEVATLATELPLEHVGEEGRVEVDALVGGAVERADLGRRLPAAGAGPSAEGPDLGRPVAARELPAPVLVQRVLDSDPGAVHVIVGIGTGLAVGVAVGVDHPTGVAAGLRRV